MSKTFYTLFIFLVLLNSINSQSQNLGDELDALFERLEMNNDFNGNIIIAKGDDIIYHKSIGYADFSNQIPNTKETVFELASMGKQFTAMGILILEEQEKLDIDKTVSHYLENFPYPNVTIRHLLTMCSGIPDYLNFSQEWDVNTIVTNQSILEYYQVAQPKVNFLCGEKFEYSNVNYVFLAEIIKRVSKQTFEMFLKKNIFDKIGMTSTRSYTTRFSKKEVIANYAYPYIKADKNYIKADEYPNTQYVIAASGIEGDGSIVSTTSDLFKWKKAIQNGDIVSLDLVNKAYSKPELNDGSKSKYGFGMYVGDEKLWHWGGWPGVQTSYTQYLSNDITIIYMKNLESNNWNWVSELEKIIIKL